MKLKSISAAAVTLGLMLTMGVSAASAGSSSSSSSSAPSSSSSAGNSSSGAEEKGHEFHGRRVCGHGGAMQILAQVTGESVDSLTAKYPQKTAWQIAKKLNKLDDLKKEFLSKNKTALDGLVSAGRIDAAESEKIYADLQKRVAAIDGVNTVILGRPTYMPKVNKSESKAAA